MVKPWFLLTTLGLMVAGCSYFQKETKPEIPARARSSALSKNPKIDKAIRVRMLMVAPQDETDLNLSATFYDSLLREMRKGSRILTVQSPRFDDIARRNDSAIDGTLALTEGRKMGVQAVLIPKIIKASVTSRGESMGLLQEKVADISVDILVRLVDATTGKELMNELRHFESPVKSYVVGKIGFGSLEEKQRKALERGLADLAKELTAEISVQASRLGWRGKIAKVAGPSIYVNAGKASGLGVGDILKVTKPGEDIYDPESGALIGKAEGRVKGTLEIVGYVGEDGATCLLHSGGGFSEQDIVSLY